MNPDKILIRVLRFCVRPAEPVSFRGWHGVHGSGRTGEKFVHFFGLSGGEARLESVVPLLSGGESVAGGA